MPQKDGSRWSAIESMVGVCQAETRITVQVSPLADNDEVYRSGWFLIARGSVSDPILSTTDLNVRSSNSVRRRSASSVKAVHRRCANRLGQARRSSGHQTRCRNLEPAVEPAGAPVAGVNGIRTVMNASRMDCAPALPARECHGAVGRPPAASPGRPGCRYRTAGEQILFPPERRMFNERVQPTARPTGCDRGKLQHLAATHRYEASESRTWHVKAGVQHLRRSVAVVR